MLECNRTIQHTLENLGKNIEKVVYCENGNRTTSEENIFSVALEYAKRNGVISLQKLPSLRGSKIPIYSAKRPHSRNHYLYGGSLVSLGKGKTDLQSKISCLMEALEYMAAENIPENLIRGTFRSLSRSHVIMDPFYIVRLHEDNHPSKDEQLMWTRGFSVTHNCEILIPAEMVYFPFLSEEFNTNHYFYPSTNGLASGSSILEAIIHGLYEIIERAVLGHKDLNMGYKIPFQTQDFFENEGELTDTISKLNIQFYLVESFILPSIPVVESVIEYNGRIYQGLGCDSHLATALDRSLTELIQCVSTYEAGDREDVLLNDEQIREKYFKYSKKITSQSKNVIPSYNAVTNTIISKFNLEKKFKEFSSSFKTLNEEYNFLLDFLKQAGHQEFFICNLTPKDANFFVVKVISPSLMSKTSFYGLTRYPEMQNSRLNGFKYRTMNEC